MNVNDGEGQTTSKANTEVCGLAKHEDADIGEGFAHQG